MKVLIVEDDPKVAHFLQRVLIEEGYAVDVCSDGEDALAQAEIGYALMILDWMLPGVDGLEVCRQLRRRGVGLPILMLTARGELRERVLGLQTGADDYLIKPFDVEELVARVQALLRRASGPQRLELGALVLDRVARTATLEGRPIDLTVREFNLLATLAQQAGQAVTRTVLLQQVWSTSFDPESNLVEVHVSRLRNKLGQHAWMIDTVRGRGYRLRASRDA